MNGSKQLSDFDFNLLGDFNFVEQDAWLQFRIPIPVLQKLISGPSGRHLTISREEIISLLRAIDRNPETSQSYKEAVRSLLKRAQRDHATN